MDLFPQNSVSSIRISLPFLIAWAPPTSTRWHIGHNWKRGASTWPLQSCIAVVLHVDVKHLWTMWFHHRFWGGEATILIDFLDLDLNGCFAFWRNALFRWATNWRDEMLKQHALMHGHYSQIQLCLYDGWWISAINLSSIPCQEHGSSSKKKQKNYLLMCFSLSFLRVSVSVCVSVCWCDSKL